ncbi:hypothetical protein O181_042346 [Austropuccinia psidii MF-1]|uniref:Uncharacterized protein n=1 Tax=Austropuccinia psidii MF-1 TaxID=1389203 RepID=A0A9Q3HF23_9BASI|nr:hypothetical protein [Austropuccinia psidii MF-1]
MHPKSDINIIPMKMALHIGISPNNNKSKGNSEKKLTKGHINRVQIVLPTDEMIYMLFMIVGNENHLILGGKNCDYFFLVQKFNKLFEDEKKDEEYQFNVYSSKLMEINGKELFIKEESKDNLIKDLAENIGNSWNNVEILPEDPGRDGQNQLTEEEKEILELINSFFNFEAQNSEAKSLAQKMDINNYDYFSNKFTYPEDIQNTQSQSQKYTTKN